MSHEEKRRIQWSLRHIMGEAKIIYIIIGWHNGEGKWYPATHKGPDLLFFLAGC